jgi:hypothetical protein
LRCAAPEVATLRGPLLSYPLRETRLFLHTVRFLASLGLAKVKHIGNFDAVLVALLGLLALAAATYFVFGYFG